MVDKARGLLGANPDTTTRDWGMRACCTFTVLSVVLAIVSVIFMFLHVECGSAADCYGGEACVGGWCNCTSIWSSPPYRCDPTFSTRPNDLKIDVTAWLALSFIVCALVTLCCIA